MLKNRVDVVQEKEVFVIRNLSELTKQHLQIIKGAINSYLIERKDILDEEPEEFGLICQEEILKSIKRKGFKGSKKALIGFVKTVCFFQYRKSEWKCDIARKHGFLRYNRLRQVNNRTKLDTNKTSLKNNSGETIETFKHFGSVIENNEADKIAQNIIDTKHTNIDFDNLFINNKISNSISVNHSKIRERITKYLDEIKNIKISDKIFDIYSDIKNLEIDKELTNFVYCNIDKNKLFLPPSELFLLIMSYAPDKTYTVNKAIKHIGNDFQIKSDELKTVINNFNDIVKSLQTVH